MSKPTFKTDKKMSFEALLAYFGGGFIFLMLLTFLVMKMVSSPAKDKKVVIKKSSAEVAEKQIAENIPNTKIAELSDTISKMDANQREASKFIYSQNDRIKALEAQVNSLLEKYESMERLAQEERARQESIESSKKAANSLKAESQNKISSRNSRHGVRVAAVVNKRAWLENEDGDTTTVTPGDNITVRTVRVLDVNNSDKTVTTSPNRR